MWWGVFYEEYEAYLKGLRSQFTCIDIDEPSITKSKTMVDYVNFKCLDIHDYPRSRLGKHHIILMVQVFTCIPNIDKVIKRYFKLNPNGKVAIINTIFPEYQTGIVNIGRDIIAKGWFGVHWGHALTFKHMIELGKILKRHLTYNIIGQTISGHDEYIFILE